MTCRSNSQIQNVVRVIAREVENGLSCHERQEKYTEALMKFGEFVNGTQNTYLKEIESEQFKYASDIFCQNHYSRCCHRLLKSFSVDTFAYLSKETVTTINQIIQNGPPVETILVLTNVIHLTSLGFQLHKCVSLLERVLQDHILADVFWELSDVSKRSHYHTESQLRDQLITAIVSIPQVVTNILKRETSDIFYPKSYVPLVCSDIFKTLQKAKDCLGAGRDCSLEFLSHVFGRLCIAGYSEQMVEWLLPHLYPCVHRDYVWCRVCERVITGIPARCMETAITALVKQIPWYGLMGKFLGDSVVKTSSIQTLLCTKMLLHRHFQKVTVLHNIIGYLASSHTRRHLYIKVFMKLLSVWGDSSSVKHISYEQHHYISQAILVCVGHLGPQEIHAHKDEFIRLLMPGVSCHIGHSDEKMRRLGMVVAETLTSRVDPDGPKLDFQYEHDQEVKMLLSLTTVPAEPSLEELDKLFDTAVTLDEVCDVVSPGEAPAQSSSSSTSAVDGDTELDSDDDLEPYDMSHDLAHGKTKAPKYVRDCMDGLITSDDPDRTDVCLREAEALIRRKPDGLDEIAEDFTKILLHLDDKTALIDFTTRRFAAMLALAVHCPVKVCDYLTSQFYERNYNLRQRMDILEVLGAAAQELSKPPKEKSSSPPKVIEVPQCHTEPESWREIVDKRIQSKTRRFVKGASRPLPQATANRFAPVAGHFFYPLMKSFDRKENTFDLLGGDSYVLGRLVYTLGIILYCAVNTMSARQMATSLLEFTWVLRFHSDVYVRKAVLFATSMILLVIPTHCLLSDLQVDMTELKLWLEDRADKDTDSECRKMALQSLVLMENAVKQEFQAQAPIT